MSLLVKGMEMPKCDECFWCIGHRIKCPAGSKDVLLGGRHPCCPLVPVPPHGRLGDLDILKERVTKRLYASNHGSMAEAYYAALIDLIDGTPTVIQAEEV